MHNMIMKSECDGLVFDQQYDYQDPLVEPYKGVSAEFAQFLAMHHEICDDKIHHQL